MAKGRKTLHSAKIGQQAERVGRDPPLSVMDADKGIALPKVSDQYPCHIGKKYANDKGDPLVNFLMR